MKYKFYNPQAIYELGQRDNQEDSIYPAYGNATADDRLFIVCDGMGGQAKGEVASSIIASSLSNFINQYVSDDSSFSDEQFMDGLAAAVDDLNAAVQDPEDRKMGTTLVFLFFHNGGCLAAHIGDSRYYHIRPNENRIIYRSRDHSLVSDMYESGELAKSDMLTAEFKNVITRSIMPFQPQSLKPEIVHITDIKAGDWFCLLSDGMQEDMTDAELLDIIRNCQSDEQLRAELIQLTRSNADNHSAYLIHVADVIQEDGDDLLIGDEEEARARHKYMNDNSPERDVRYNQNAPTGRITSISSDVEVDGTPIQNGYIQNQHPNMPNNKSSFKNVILGVLIGVVLILIGALTYVLFFKDKKEEAPRIEIPSPVLEQSLPKTNKQSTEPVVESHVDQSNAKVENRKVESKKDENRTERKNKNTPNKGKTKSKEEALRKIVKENTKENVKERLTNPRNKTNHDMEGNTPPAVNANDLPVGDGANKLTESQGKNKKNK